MKHPFLEQDINWMAVDDWLDAEFKHPTNIIKKIILYRSAMKTHPELGWRVIWHFTDMDETLIRWLLFYPATALWVGLSIYGYIKYH